jgi:two-component system chemotaxis response regulator CheY
MVAATSQAPSRSATPASVAASVARPTPAQAGATLNMLIIEEEGYTKTLLRAVAHTIGAHQVHAAASGKAALKTADEASVNLVVCDLHLPDMSGLDLLREMRRRIPDVPFLLISNMSDPTHIQQAVDSGVSAIVVRPFSRAQIEAKLRFLAHRIAPNLAFGTARTPAVPHS